MQIERKKLRKVNNVQLSQAKANKTNMTVP